MSQDTWLLGMTDQKKGQPKVSQTSVRAHERALEIFREAPVSELKDLVFHDHIEKHSKHSFESLVQQSGHIWDGLPDSVIGTLIYFILVEHNVEGFESLSTLYYIAMVGIPVYFTFLLQADIVYELYLFLGTTNAWESYCKSSPFLLFVISCVFCIFMYPSFRTILSETYIVMKSKRVAFMHCEDDITLHNVLAPFHKRLMLWLLVVVPEFIILVFVCLTGMAYVMTSEGIENIIINSVSICFVMDIDNIARNALQTETMSEHVDDMRFDTTMKKPVESLNDGSVIADEISDETLSSFTQIEKCVAVVLLSAFISWLFVSSCDNPIPLIGRFINDDDADIN